MEFALKLLIGVVIGCAIGYKEIISININIVKSFDSQII